MIYIVNFTVTPMHLKAPRPFPIDMLRRDHMIPFSERDANIIQRTIAHDLDETSGDITVRVFRWTTNRLWQPTYGRWESFGWRVNTDTINVKKEVGL